MSVDSSGFLQWLSPLLIEWLLQKIRRPHNFQQSCWAQECYKILSIFYYNFSSLECNYPLLNVSGLKIVEVQAVLKLWTDKENSSRLRAFACFPLLLFICIALKLDKETAALEIQRNCCYVVHGTCFIFNFWNLIFRNLHLVKISCLSCYLSTGLKWA